MIWERALHTATMLLNGNVLLIPGTQLAISGGKQGVLYVVNRDNMGGVSSGIITVGSAGIGTYLDSNGRATNAFYRLTYP